MFQSSCCQLHRWRCATRLLHGTPTSTNVLYELGTIMDDDRGPTQFNLTQHGYCKLIGARLRGKVVLLSVQSSVVSHIPRTVLGSRYILLACWYASFIDFECALCDSFANSPCEGLRGCVPGLSRYTRAWYTVAPSIVAAMRGLSHGRRSGTQVDSAQQSQLIMAIALKVLNTVLSNYPLRRYPRYCILPATWHGKSLWGLAPGSINVCCVAPLTHRRCDLYQSSATHLSRVATNWQCPHRR
jgi:hypothetical protein